MDIRQYTDNTEVIKAWACPDAELQTMVRILPHCPLSCRDQYRQCIQLHKEYIESGLVVVPWEYQSILQRLDPYLRLRWDMQCQCYIIERIDTSLRAWVRLFRWANDDDSPRPLSVESCREIVGKLQASDMRRASTPEEYLQIKRDKAKAIRDANDVAQTERLMAVIDSMSGKQISEFISAERAIATGERIDVRGDDAKTLNMWHDMGKAGAMPSLPGQDQAVNPGMAPGVR